MRKRRFYCALFILIIISATGCAMTQKKPREFYYNQAVTAATEGRFTEAETQYQQIIETNPDFLQAHNNLGVLFLRQDRLNEAVSAFQKALSIKPTYLAALLNLALAYEAMGKTEIAQATWEKAQLLEKRPELHGRIAMRINELEEGLAAVPQSRSPLLAIFAPLWGAKITSRGVERTGTEEIGTIEVIGNASSDAGIIRIELMLDGKHISTVTDSVPPRTIQSFSFTPKISDLTMGKHTITVSVYDANNIVSSRSVEVTYIPESIEKVYQKSVGVVIGINKYKYWPPLNYAVNDANKISEKLTAMYFDEIISLTDEEATRENILGLFSNSGSSHKNLPDLMGEQDRVFIFFAGHGGTEKLKDSGRHKGYIIPVDAKENSFATAISMEELREVSERIKAKHIFYAMDSCYSGSVLVSTRGQEVNPMSSEYLQQIAEKDAVEMLTAGGAGEKVHEKDGHGIFTQYLLQGLDGEADLNHDGVVTGSELGMFVRQPVADTASASGGKQTPLYGRLKGEGEMIFVP